MPLESESMLFTHVFCYFFFFKEQIWSTFKHSAVLRFPFTFTENDITVIAAQGLAGLLNLESLNMSKNRLDDESFGPNSLPVSIFASCIAS